MNSIEAAFKLLPAGSNSQSICFQHRMSMTSSTAPASAHALMEAKKLRPQFTATLASFTSGLSPAMIDADIEMLAKTAIADTVGVLIAGLDEEVVATTRTAGQRELGSCGIPGSTMRTSARSAALVMGAAAHALDFDDDNVAMTGHSSSPVLPAVLALADEERVTGQDFLLAFIAGIEVESRVGMAVRPFHGSIGWHTTPTLGTLGATAAACRLLKLDAHTTQMALSLAVSLAAGVKGNAGSMAKPLHAGFAAQNGVLAARLAQAGATGVATIIEGHEGFMELFGRPDFECLQQLALPIEKPTELRAQKPKLYSCCSLVHPLIDMILDARRSGVRANAIESIEVRISPYYANAMRFSSPKDITECRFSTEFCVAAALVDGELTVPQFAPESLQRPEILSLMKKVNVRLRADKPEWSDMATFMRDYKAGRTATTVDIRCEGSSVYQNENGRAKGHPDDPLSVAEFQGKFMSCVTPKFGATRAHEIWTTLMRIEEVPTFDTRAISAETHG